MSELRRVSGIELVQGEMAARPAHIGYDVLRNPSGTLILVNQFKAAEFIAENPSFSIVGIGLSAEATDTPYGKIGAVLE